VRISTSVLLSLALLVAFVQAPFLHTHQHESTQRHAGAFLHFHVRSAHPLGKSPEFRGLDPNEDAQYQGWFSATATDSGSMIPVIHAQPSTLPAPELSGWSTETPIRSGHDPPLLNPRSPRAPPV
jgi:hypothetical protein